MVTEYKIIPSFAAKAAVNEEVRDERSYFPHIVANKKLLAGLVDPNIPTTKSKRRQKKRQKNTPRPNLCLYPLDPTFPSKTEYTNTKIFYNDFKGIPMTYPENSEHVRYVTRNLRELELRRDHKDVNNFNVIVGHPKEDKEIKTFVALKVSSTRSKATLPQMVKNSVLMENMLESMPTVVRGGTRKGVESKYICYGHRKNPLDCMLGKYAFKPKISDEDKRKVKEGVEKWVRTIEGHGMQHLKRAQMANDGVDAFLHVKEMFQLPSISRKDGVATQLALAKGYCSPVHVDNDFFYSTLSCYDAKASPDQTLYHFCFPSYGVAIPMRSGDIIVFNPLVPHCASNPRLESSLIYSLYVSNKTCNTHVANRVNKDEN